MDNTWHLFIASRTHHTALHRITWHMDVIGGVRASRKIRGAKDDDEAWMRPSLAVLRQGTWIKGERLRRDDRFV